MTRFPSAIRYVRPIALPPMAALLPLLFFFNHGSNLAEIDPADGFKLLIVVAASALVILAFCRLFMKDWERASILAALAGYFVFTFMPLYDTYRDLAPAFAAHGRYFVVLSLALAVLFAFWLRRLSGRWVRLTAIYLLIVTSVLFLFQTYSIAAFEFGSSRLTAADTDINQAAPTRPATSKPDVYYIVLDRYTGPTGLQMELHFNNSPYLNQLRKRGFYVAKRSYGNYPGTIESLPSSLNASYFRAKPKPKSSTQGDATYYHKALVQLLQDPAVPRFFKRQGYEFIQLASWWGVTQHSKIANRIISYDFRSIVVMGKTFHLTDADDKFIERTALAKLLKTDIHIGSFKVFAWGKEAARSRRRSASLFLRQVNDLERIAAEKRGAPKFVFVHMLMPHGPYVFNVNGGPLPPGLSNNERYLRQLQFTNNQVLKLVDRLHSIYGGKPPVIMLVSDEGEHPAHFSFANSLELQEKYNISSAYYFPGIKHTALYQTITPVNYFRVLMNDYFHANLALLPDRNYTSVSGAVDITSRLRHPLAAEKASTK